MTISEESLENFIHIYENDNNSRYKSYDYCREAFIKYRKNSEMYDYIALNLFAYLASWGMLRNSFLLQKDYRFLVPLVEILCEEKYDCLLNKYLFKKQTDEYIEKVLDITKRVSDYFKGTNYYIDGSNEKKVVKNVTDTLISKILLGTFGCIPAYDENVKKSFKKFNICQTLNKNSLYSLTEFAKEHIDAINNLCSKLSDIYTPMKVLDIFFYEQGIKP